MDTVALDTPTQCATLAVTTYRRLEFIDLTDRIDAVIADSGLRQGLVNIQSLHTTAAVIVNEHEPLLLTDFVALLEAPDDTTAAKASLAWGSQGTSAPRPCGRLPRRNSGALWLRFPEGAAAPHEVRSPATR